MWKSILFLLLAVAVFAANMNAEDASIAPNQLISRATISLSMADEDFRNATKHFDAITKLRERGHASFAEEISARSRLLEATANKTFADSWLEMAKLAGHDKQIEAAAVAPLRASRILWLPSDEGVHSVAPTRLQLDQLAMIATLEREALPLELYEFDLHCLRRYESALRDLGAEADTETLAEEIARLEDSLNALRRQADRLATLGHSKAGHNTFADEITEPEICSSIGNGARPEVCKTILRAAWCWLEANREIAIAKAERDAAVVWQSKLANVPAEHRRPQETEIAERRVTRARLAFDSAVMEKRSAVAAVRFAISLNQTQDSIDWSSVIDSDSTAQYFVHVSEADESDSILATSRSSLPVQDTLDLASIDSRKTDRKRFPADVQGRDLQWHATGSGPQFSNAFERSRWSDNTRPGIARRERNRDLTPQFLEPVMSERSAWKRVGMRYSSGYAFGEVRRDLPAQIRFPRADGYGGPWYMPGSPINELRLRYRLPLDAR